MVELLQRGDARRGAHRPRPPVACAVRKGRVGGDPLQSEVAIMCGAVWIIILETTSTGTFDCPAPPSPLRPHLAR